MLIFFLFLILWLKKKKKTTEPTLMLFRSAGSGQAWVTILLIAASQAPQENARETACLHVRQRLAVVLHLLWSTFLTRWVGPRHATFASLSPSNPVRPQLFSSLELYRISSILVNTFGDAPLGTTLSLDEVNKTHGPI